MNFFIPQSQEKNSGIGVKGMPLTPIPYFQFHFTIRIIKKIAFFSKKGLQKVFPHGNINKHSEVLE